ncbi:MAG: HAMP domain-containing histidine kinase, partial [Clostridia bacterium]|nr:HAMP domain-containing histidine kinase [Clostridia bacterium]
LVSPIREMSRAAKEYASGRFDARVTVKGNDEIAELGTAFNNMAASLSSNEEMRRLFLANVSHDLRTPMTTISGFIDGMLDGAIPEDQRDYYLGVVASETRRLSRLVSSLLSITQIQAGERKFVKKPFDVCETCREIIISSEQRINERDLSVSLDCKSDNMYVLADKDAVHQIIYNLVDNAIKYSTKGTEFVISIKEEDNKIQVSVFNYGEGISEDDLPHVFERFYKTDKSRGLDKSGSGLGLYIAKTICEAHGERIYAESKHGSWCKFTFTLEKCTKPRKKTADSR